MNDATPKPNSLPLAYLLRVLPLSDWEQLNRMFEAINEAWQCHRPISKPQTAAKRLCVSESVFSKFRKRVQQSLRRIFQKDVLIFDDDFVITEDGDHVEELAAWVVSVTKESSFIFR